MRNVCDAIVASLEKSGGNTMASDDLTVLDARRRSPNNEPKADA